MEPLTILTSITKFIKSIFCKGKSDIHLGGQGGSAPGAGGGGGGVLSKGGILNSSHLKAGDGGRGGDTITLKGKDATAPGAGGGGAGAIGEGAIGGGGGEGGQQIEATLNAKDFHHIEIEIGKGGENGQKGGDTIVKLMNEYNEIVGTLCAKGGKPGHPGSHGGTSSLARELTKEEFDNGATISAILLADVIQIKDGLANLLSASWEFYKVPSFPYSISLPLFLVFSFSNLQTPSIIKCHIRIKNPDHTILLEDIINFTKLENGAHRGMNLKVLTLNVVKAGTVTIEVISGDMVLATLPLTVISS